MQTVALTCLLCSRNTPNDKILPFLKKKLVKIYKLEKQNKQTPKYPYLSFPAWQSSENSKGNLSPEAKCQNYYNYYYKLT